MRPTEKTTGQDTPTRKMAAKTLTMAQDPAPRFPGTLAPQIVHRAPNSLRVNPRNVRRHSKRQIRQIASSIEAFGYLAPILIDENDEPFVGLGRLAAAKLLRLNSVGVWFTV